MKTKTKTKTKKWPKSGLCKADQHDWCANRSAEESHCTCPCHSAKRVERLKQKFDNIHTDYIVKLVTARFRTFGGGQTSQFNPLVNMLSDKEPQFAAGVDVREVVDYIVGATLRQS